MMGIGGGAGLDAGLLGSGVGTCLAASSPYYTCVFSPEKQSCRCVHSLQKCIGGWGQGKEVS